MLQQLMLLRGNSRPTFLSSGSAEEDADELGACGTDQQPNISESSSGGFQVKRRWPGNL